MDEDASAVKVWTVEEANAALPRVKPILARAREATAQRSRILTPAEAEETARVVAEAARELAEMGVELKDPTIGLIDFPTLRGHELVYLCWKAGEAEVAHWHPFTGGFGARKPLDALVRAGGR